MRRIITQVYLFLSPLMIPILVCSLIGVGMWLRVTDADMYPVSQNDDGLFYVWSGNSILDNFWHPTSLTIFEKENPKLVWRSQYKNIYPVEAFGYRLSDPWFDHPPLGTIVIALPARILGYRDFSQIPHMVVRASALLAGMASLWMTYLLASTVFNRYVGILSLSVLAFWPLAVFSSRQSYIENIMTPFWLLSLWLTWKMRKNKKRWWLIVLCGSNFFLAWSKIIGYLAFFVSSFFLWEKRRRPAIIILIVGLFTGLLYLVYGQMVGGSYFWNNLLNQGVRGAYVSSFFSILNHPEIYGIIEDGWWFLGWFGLLYLAGGKTQERKFISLAAFFWVVGLFFLAGPQSNSPWYRYPIYPLLSIGVGVMLKDWWEKTSLLPGLCLLVLGLTGYSLAGMNISSSALRLITIIYVGLLVFNQLIMPKEKRFWLTRGLMIIMLSVTLYGNFKAIQEFPEKICKDRGCVTPVKVGAQ